MNNLKEYIIEKLSINKNTKLSDSIDYELLGRILFSCGGYGFQWENRKEFAKKKEKSNDPLIKEIIKWLKKYDVMDINAYADHRNLSDWGETGEVIDSFIDDQEKVDEYEDEFYYNENFIEKFEGYNKPVQYEIYYDDKAFLYRETTNRNLWAKKVFIKTK